jgi:hypothetical protein
MHIITDSDVWEGTGKRRRSDLYDTVQQLAEGETAHLVNGEDFPETDNPNLYRQRLISSMKYRGVSIETRIIDGDIYARVVSRA